MKCLFLTRSSRSLDQMMWILIDFICFLGDVENIKGHENERYLQAAILDVARVYLSFIIIVRYL